MVAETAAKAAERRLNSWKEIAALVGRDERTVKRWERTRGLPVRRLPGPGHVYVFAYVDEIRAWLNGAGSGSATAGPAAEETSGRSHSQAKSSTRMILAVVVALAITALVGSTFRADQSGVTASRAGVTEPPPAAVQLYRSGLHEWQSRTPQSLARAISDFKKAIHIDPEYAEAYAGLADTYNLLGEYTAASSDSLYPQAASAAKRAIALAPSLSAPHAALAFTDFYWLRDTDDAEREFRRAIALDPRNATAHHWFATFLMTVGSFHEALDEIDRAEDLDSESDAIPADKGIILFHAGRKVEGIRLLTQLELDRPSFASPHRYLAAIWLSLGKDTDYLSELKLCATVRHDENDLALATTGTTGLAQGGRIGMLRAILATQQILYSKGQQSAFRLAATYALLNDFRNAFAYLAISISRHEADNIALKIDMPFESLHKDPRFAELIASAGLDARPQPGRP